MRIRTRLVLGAAASLAAVAALPAGASPANPAGGNGSTSCADGTVTWSPTTLWPPNHKMQTITINYVAPSDLPGDQTTITVGAITDNQAASDGTGELKGSGQPTAQQGLDWAGTGNSATSSEGSRATTTAQVRAERSGTAAGGRTYTIQLMCSESNSGVPDPTGSGSTSITVFVPHDQGQHNGG
jgi:hypothetical protein